MNTPISEVRDAVMIAISLYEDELNEVACEVRECAALALDVYEAVVEDATDEVRAATLRLWAKSNTGFQGSMAAWLEGIAGALESGPG